MSAKLNNKYGCIEIDKQVIAQVVYRAAMESYGLVGFSQNIPEILFVRLKECCLRIKHSYGFTKHRKMYIMK